MNLRRFSLALLLQVLGFAQAPDAANILRRADEAGQTNDTQAALYAYREYVVTTELDKNGKQENRRTETWDVIGLEGSTYRKLIQRDDKPLAPKDQKSEDKRLAEETKKRRNETAEQRKNRTFSLQYNLSFGPGSMHLYDISYLGEEVVNGRPAYMIQGVPKTSAQPANDNEKELLHYRVKRWIDKEAHLDARIDLEVVQPGSRMQPGTLISTMLKRLDDGVWIESENRFDFNLRFFKVIGVRGMQVRTRSGFQKFEVNSRIIDSPQ